MKLKIIALLFIAATAFTAACSTTYTNGTNNYESILDHSIDDEYLLV